MSGGIVVRSVILQSTRCPASSDYSTSTPREMTEDADHLSEHGRGDRSSSRKARGVSLERGIYSAGSITQTVQRREEE